MKIREMCSGLVERLSRLPRSHGFGVQSPSDYRFVTQTLRADIPDCMKKKLPADKALARLCRLVFLVSAGIKPRSFLNLTACKQLDNFIILSPEGCNAGGNVDFSEADLLICDDKSLCYDEEKAENLLLRAADKACLIMTNIYLEGKISPLWQYVVACKSAVITFDAYCAGIVFFDRKRYKQHYKIFF